MNVLRDNKDSVMAMLEAFVYDPLISWRLLGPGKDDVQEDIWGESVKSPVNRALERVQEESADTNDSDDDDDDEDNDGRVEQESSNDLGILSPSAAGDGLQRSNSYEAPEEGGINENINSRYDMESYLIDQTILID